MAIPAPTTPRVPPDQGPGAWIGFLAAAFVVVGLTGLFATFAAPLPLERALGREQALDAAMVAAHGPDPLAALQALRDRLDDSADAVVPKPGAPVPGDIDARIAAERTAMRTRLLADSQATSERLRWLICIVTIMSAVFGAAVMHAGRRRATPPAPGAAP